MIFSKLIAARIAYGVDRAIAGSGALWEQAVALHPTWFQYVSNYVQRGTIPSLGSATRNNAFVALMQVAKPGIQPTAASVQITSITLSSLVHNGVHTDAPFTLTVICKDASGRVIPTPAALTWISDSAHATVASPAADGVVTPVSAGVANVKARLLASAGMQQQVDSSACVVTLS